MLANMTFNTRVLVRVIEVPGLVPKGNADVKLTARLELFRTSDGLYRCQLAFLESLRVLPTDVALTLDETTGGYDVAGKLCDKEVYAVEETLGFEELVSDSVDALARSSVELLVEYFSQDVG
jgi:hypothetical protein